MIIYEGTTGGLGMIFHKCECGQQITTHCRADGRQECDYCSTDRDWAVSTFVESRKNGIGPRFSTTPLMGI